MRWKTLAIGLGTAVLGSVGGSIGFAQAAAPTDETVVVVQQAPDQQFVDLGASGPSPGDILVFHSALTDTNGGDAGDLNIQCGVNFSGLAVCVGIFTIDGRGQLAVDALPQLPLPTTGIVTGGNDDFRNVRGEADIQPQADGTTLITFHLIGTRAR
ncbi:MAG TPA: hypothetical protein VF984_11595 [Actinomycetota bacterium]